MRKYGTVAPTFWLGTTGRALRAEGHHAQLLALYLITSPHANMVGLYYVPLSTIAFETGLTETEVVAAFEALDRHGFCRRDLERSLVWIIEMAKFQIAPKMSPDDSRHAHVVRELAAHLDSPLAAAFVERYGDAFNLKPYVTLRGPVEAPSTPPQPPSDGEAPERADSHLNDDSATPPAFESGRGVDTPPRRPLDAMDHGSEIREQEQEQEQDQTTDPAAGAAGERKVTKSARKGRKNGRTTEPLSFAIGPALDTLRGCERIVVPAKLDGRRVGQIQTIIRRVQTLDALRLVVAWLLAGGEAYRKLVDLSALCSNVDTWLTAATKWDAAGRPPLGRGGASGDGPRGLCWDDA